MVLRDWENSRIKHIVFMENQTAEAAREAYNLERDKLFYPIRNEFFKN